MQHEEINVSRAKYRKRLVHVQCHPHTSGKVKVNGNGMDPGHPVQVNKKIFIYHQA